MHTARGGFSAFLLLAVLQTEGVSPRDGLVTLPPGAVAELLEHVDLAAPRRPFELAWPEWSDRTGTGWGSELPWRRWVELVRAEAAARIPDAARRAELAALARIQGRDGDAWAHLLACASDPPTVAALFPLFLPGVPLELVGSSAPWPEGLLLRPALPPADDPRAPLRVLSGRAFEQRSVAVSGARFTLRVEVDRDGTGVYLTHLEGEPARVRVVAPVPQGIDPGLLFADWEKLDRNDEPVEFSLGGDAPEHSLWLTFHPPGARWPTPRSEALSALRPERGLVLLTPRTGDPLLARFAEALAELFGIPARVASEIPRAPGLEPLVMNLEEAQGGERKLVSLIGLAESFALERRSENAGAGRTRR